MGKSRKKPRKPGMKTVEVIVLVEPKPPRFVDGLITKKGEAR